MPIIEPTCTSVASEVRARFEETRAGLAAYWIVVQSDRHAYARQLQALLGGHPIGIIVLRRSGLFENANSVMADVVTLVTEARPTLEHVFSEHASSRRWGVVVISRTPMTIGQSSSPVELPDWFPDLGGKEIHSSIEDVTWLSRVTLDDVDLPLADLHRNLYSVEGALLRRLRKANAVSVKSQAAFFNLVKKPDEPSLLDTLDLAQDEWRQVPNPNAYRPSAKVGRAIVARLWWKSSLTRPLYFGNDLVVPAAKALMLDRGLLRDMSIPDSLFALLGKPSPSTAPPEDQRFVNNLIWAVCTSFRLLTVSHHADGYGRFPYTLLYGVGEELRATLASYEQVLNLHD